MAQIFPRWANRLPLIVAACSVLGLAAPVLAAWYYLSPGYTDVGYQPRQPVAYSHRAHVGDLGLDCRFCHAPAEYATRASVPDTGTCNICHGMLVLPKSVALAPLRAATRSGRPIRWVRVHMLPDFAFFDHGAHSAAGVGCRDCHGPVDRMTTVYQAEPLSMSWCLDCHRHPADRLRPPRLITDMAYEPRRAGYDPTVDPQRARQVSPPLHCTGCHR